MLEMSIHPMANSDSHGMEYHRIHSEDAAFRMMSMECTLSRWAASGQTHNQTLGTTGRSKWRREQTGTKTAGLSCCTWTPPLILALTTRSSVAPLLASRRCESLHWLSQCDQLCVVVWCVTIFEIRADNLKRDYVCRNIEHTKQQA